MEKKYFVYIITNKHKTTLYIGVTNNLKRRISEHYQGIQGGFSKKYKCKYLLYYESFNWVMDAIKREKQIKKYSRVKKNKLIASINPDLRFLNEEIGI